MPWSPASAAWAVSPTPGRAAGWAGRIPRPLQSGTTAGRGRTGRGTPSLRGALGECVMAAARTDTRLGEQYRRIARRRGKQKAIVAVSRVICEIACILIADPAAPSTDLGATYDGSPTPTPKPRPNIRRTDRPTPC